MSDHYDHKGITITPQPGGYYDLTHPNLAEPVRERGKEKAEQRADELLAAGLGADPGHIEPQGEIPDEPPAPPAQDPAMVAMLEQMAAMNARIEELTAAGVTTVAATDGQEAPSTQGAPSSYVGKMDPAVRKMLKEQGHSTVKIILEENESIPPTGLFMQHNGRPYMIQPGVPVEVPDFLVNLLDNAVMSMPIVDAKSMKVLGYRDRLKYGYRRVD